MKTYFKSFIIQLGRFSDVPFAFFVFPAAVVLFLYRRFGSSRLPICTALLKKIGVFPIIDHYYEPFFNTKLLGNRLSQDRNLPGINFNVVGQLDFLIGLKYTKELVDLNLNQQIEDINSFAFNNGRFESGDVEYLYQFIRKTKPSKIVEIGSGHSTKIAHIALTKNKTEENISSKHICIEPYEMPWLEMIKGINVLRNKVEDCDIQWESELKSGDLLFVDSSHMIRPQGDVLKEYLEIFPRLASGVYIHIHDIFTPRDYLESWIVDDVRFWNEQYLLEALLSNTNRYEIVGALNFLKNNHFDKLKEICPYLNSDREPGSFYIRVL